MQCNIKHNFPGLTTSWWDTDSITGTEIWMGDDREIEWTPYAPWQELYHEEDYQGIADQLLAEEMGWT